MKTHPSSLLTPFSELMACFTTRLGGVSAGAYDSANLAFHVGDDPGDVLRNHDRLAETLGYERSRLVHMRQVHSDRIVVVNESNGFDAPPECDALITDRRNVPLMVMSADCTPVLLYDPTTRTIGAVHAGRAGALKRIVPQTLDAMERTYGAKRTDIRVSMGPSIGGCCYEINPAIALEVRSAGYPEALRLERERVFLDVNSILLQQLREMEIAEESVEIIEACTACRSDIYFSYRADAQKTGRIAGVIMLR